MDVNAHNTTDLLYWLQQCLTYYYYLLNNDVDVNAHNTTDLLYWLQQCLPSLSGFHSDLLHHYVTVFSLILSTSTSLRLYPHQIILTSQLGLVFHRLCNGFTTLSLSFHPSSVHNATLITASFQFCSYWNNVFTFSTNQTSCYTMLSKHSSDSDNYTFGLIRLCLIALSTQWVSE